MDITLGADSYSIYITIQGTIQEIFFSLKNFLCGIPAVKGLYENDPLRDIGSETFYTSFFNSRYGETSTSVRLVERYYANSPNGIAYNGTGFEAYNDNVNSEDLLNNDLYNIERSFMNFTEGDSFTTSSGLRITLSRNTTNPAYPIYYLDVTFLPTNSYPYEESFTIGTMLYNDTGVSQFCAAMYDMDGYEFWFKSPLGSSYAWLYTNINLSLPTGFDSSCVISIGSSLPASTIRFTNVTPDVEYNFTNNKSIIDKLEIKTQVDYIQTLNVDKLTVNQNLIDKAKYQKYLLDFNESLSDIYIDLYAEIESASFEDLINNIKNKITTLRNEKSEYNWCK